LENDFDRMTWTPLTAQIFVHLKLNATRKEPINNIVLFSHTACRAHRCIRRLSTIEGFPRKNDFRDPLEVQRPISLLGAVHPLSGKLCLSPGYDQEQ
jgi:hypothetical protein